MLRRRAPQDLMRSCATCGISFHPDRLNGKYCSRECSNLGHVLPRRICPVCGNPQPDRKKADRIHCSRECAAVAAVKPRRACPICKERPVRLGSKTCSDRCGYMHRKLRTRRPRPCLACGKEFMPYPSSLSRGAGKYCSLACYRSVSSVRPQLITVSCLNCRASFRRTAAAVKRVSRSFCSRSCLTAHNQGENSPTWRGGTNAWRGKGWQRIAESIRDRDGRLCRWCGKSESDNGQRLSVDHVIPWRTFTDEGAANDPANLVSLCRHCHGKKGRAENRWLKGDVLDMWQYQIAVSQPWQGSIA